MQRIPIAKNNFSFVSRPQALSNWLFFCAGMVFFMIVLGGWTRLTGSGLSMVQWNLGTFLPPLTEQDWLHLFNQYQLSPEYQQINLGMSLKEFRSIFWLEYIHRLWGRLIGIVFLIPVLLSFFSPILRGRFSFQLLGVWILGALQGALGWYMVKSGLIEDPQVSPYRLAAHLILGFATYGFLIIYALKLRGYIFHCSQGGLYYAALIGVFLTVFYGALVAGLKAGLIYNTFPFMNGAWLPEEAFYLNPLGRNFFENAATVQFMHRCLGLSSVLLIGSYWFQSKRASRQAFFSFMAFLGTTFQSVLGALTLIYHVPISLASAHQANAIVLFTLLLLIPFRRGEQFQEAPFPQPIQEKRHRPLRHS